MKIQCDVCEKAEASVLCCADEAALCFGCDEKVHAANKLAGKHQRVPLLSSSSSSVSSSSSKTPVCDICQEKTGYFFCLEDRALLCRQCDLSIHTASPFVSAHQRFLITGVRVALQPCNANNRNNNSSNSTSSNGNCSNNALSSLASTDSAPSKKLCVAPDSYAVQEIDDFRPQWHWNYFLDGVEFDQCYGLSEPGSSS